MDLHIQRPISLSIIYHVRQEVYEDVLETCTKYCWTGISMWQDLANNYHYAKLSVESVQSILSNHGMLGKITFVYGELDKFLFGDDHDFIKSKPIRDWNTVYKDLVKAGIDNRNVKDTPVNWVLDGKIINLEPAEPPVL